MAWWYVPRKHEPVFFHVLEHVWTHVVSPSTSSLILAYFQLVLPCRDYPQFERYFQGILQCLEPDTHGSP